MASSFSSQGATPISSYPGKGLLKGVGNFLTNTVPKAFGVQEPQGNYTPTSGSQVPQGPLQSGLIHPTTPMAQPTSHTTITAPDGTSTTKQTFAPDKPGTNFQQNLGNVGNQAQYGNQQEQQINQNLLNAGLYYGNKGAAPLGGFNIGGAAQGFQQAQAGLLNSQVAAAQPALQDIQAQRQARLGGAEAQAGLTAPQPYGITTTPYSPGTNQFGTLPGGGQGAFGAGVVQSQIQGGQNFGTSAQAIGKAQPVAANLDTLINENSINPTNLTYANGAINFLKSNAGTTQQQAAMTEFNGQLNDLASTLAPILGIPGGATTDFKTQLGQSIVNGLQNGQSIQQSIQYFIKQAQTGALGAAQGAQNPYGTINSSGSGLYNF